MDILELKHIISEIKFLLNGLNSILDTAGEKTDTLGHNVVDHESVPKKTGRMKTLN